MSSSVIQEKAYAKINLGLKVLGKRPDGYHNILTVMQTVSLHDTLTVSETGGEISLACSHPDVPAGPSNLAYQAALALKRESGMDKGVHIELEKRIPVGAGLGGGSSDAAAALRALPNLWRVDVAPSKLSDIALSLGADVPFLLSGGTAVARGRGEELQYVDRPERSVYLLVYPGFGVSTRWAYGQVEKRGLTGESEYVKFVLSGIAEPSWSSKLHRCLENDFEQIVGESYPQTLQIKAQLLELGALAASLSGSGSTVFGVFEAEEAARRVAPSFQNEASRVFVCSSLP